MNHPSLQDLLEHAGGTAGDRRGAEIDAHLASCESCRAAYRAFSAVEGALHRLPEERPSEELTRNVLSRIGVRETPPLWWLFLRNFAPILVAGIVAGVIIAIGGTGGGGPAPSVGNSLIDTARVWDSLRGWLDAFTAWMGGAAAGYVPIRIGNHSLNLALFLACLFAGLGLLDRYVLQPILRRRR